MNVRWSIKTFASLSVRELHDVLRMRVEVFVVEQRCAYAEVDGRDPEALHILAQDEAGELLAYARMLPPCDEAPPRIGRVVVAPAHRGKGLAHGLMRQATAALVERYASDRALLSAQVQLESFYGAHGFQRTGPDYDWDGIPHVDMRRG